MRQPKFIAATQPLQAWHRLGLRIRLALRPDEPAPVRAYLVRPEALAAHGLCPA